MFNFVTFFEKGRFNFVTFFEKGRFNFVFITFFEKGMFNFVNFLKSSFYQVLPPSEEEPPPDDLRTALITIIINIRAIIPTIIPIIMIQYCSILFPII